MKKYYLRNDFPIKTNYPMDGDIPILEKLKNESEKDYLNRSEQEYKRICKERNDQAEAEQIKKEEEMRPVREQRKRIQTKIEEMALQELGEIKL